MKLILLLTLSDFVYSSANLINPIVGLEHVTCNALGFIKVFAGWTSLLWIGLISLFIYSAFGGFPNLNLTKLLRWLILGCMVASLVTALTPLLNISGLIYTPVNGFCGVFFVPGTTKAEKFIISVTTRVLPYLMATIMTIAAYVRAFKFFREIPKEAIRASDMDSKRLLIYPTAQLIIYTPNSLATFELLWVSGYSEFGFILGTTLYNLCGFVNCLVYGRQFRKKQDMSRELTEDLDSPSSANDLLLVQDDL